MRKTSRLIYVASAEGGKSTAINANLDQVISEMEWAEHGKAIYFDSGVKGETHVYRMDASTGAVKPLTAGRAQRPRVRSS